MIVNRSFVAHRLLTGSLFIILMVAGCSSAPQETAPRRAASASPAASPAATASNSTLAVAHGSSSLPSGSAAVSSPAASSDSGQGAGGGTRSAGGITWTAPARWKTGPEREMRAVTYLIPSASGDSEGGECPVFFFGPGQGGGVEANIKRWIGQFEQPDGKPSEPLARQKKETINGLTVTTIDLSGTFVPMMRQGSKKPGYRMLGAIVEGPQGAVFFKLTGPAKTVVAAQAEFQALLKSLGTN
jgi:hypothetical protein